MAGRDEETTTLINRLRGGDTSALSALILHAQATLVRRARRMLRNYPGVRRWEDTDDVAQNATLRLHRALSDLTPMNSLHFWNLVSTAIRRVLLDLARHYQGPQGHGANHHTDGAGGAADDPNGPIQNHGDDTAEPRNMAEWAQFHERVNQLPEREREVFHLRYYADLTQEEVAAELNVSRSEVRRRWLRAILWLAPAVPSGH